MGLIWFGNTRGAKSWHKPGHDTIVLSGTCGMICEMAGERRGAGGVRRTESERGTRVWMTGLCCVIIILHVCAEKKCCQTYYIGYDRKVLKLSRRREIKGDQIRKYLMCACLCVCVLLSCHACTATRASQLRVYLVASLSLRDPIGRVHRTYRWTWTWTIRKVEVTHTHVRGTAIPPIPWLMHLMHDSVHDTTGPI